MEKMSVSGYMPWSLHKAQDLGGKERTLASWVVNDPVKRMGKEVLGVRG